MTSKNLEVLLLKEQLEKLRIHHKTLVNDYRTNARYWGCADVMDCLEKMANAAKEIEEINQAIKERK